MKVTYNITQNKFNAILNQETTEIKVKFQTGYYPLPGGGGGDLSNYYTKSGTFSQTEINNLLNNKQDKLSSYDESILIEDGGNVEGNISLFEEYFEQQECELNFTPIQIVAVYQDGIKLLKSEYEIILPKKIKIKEYVDENIQIEYTHLKS